MTNRELNKESFLVKNLKEGDRDAFSILFEDYSHRLFQFAFNYLKSETEAEGIVQEVFIKIWVKRKDLNPDYSFKSYLFTITYNLVKKRFAKSAKENELKNELIFSYLEKEDNLDEIIDYKSLLELVEKIIDSMPPKRKEIFIKRKYVGLSVKEIAEEMDISPNTVENQLGAAKKYIFEKLGKKQLAGLIFYTLFID